MKDPDQDLAERALGRRKREDAAFVVPLVGVTLLVSPILNIFSDGTVAGLPASYVYLFAVWAGLILVTRSLARRLVRGEEQE